ncbi:hypothetical protein L6R46_29195, partial [Myxococcota bacterium]|nr:hypothetical protein [Myxococcota bacterium]
MTALLLALTTQSLAATLSVGPSGDYATLSDAIDAAQDGDVLELEAGRFDGGVSLNALDLTIRGAGAGRRCAPLRLEPALEAEVDEHREDDARHSDERDPEPALRVQAGD